MRIPTIIGLSEPSMFLLITAYGLFCFVMGMDAGSPILNISEIVWVEPHHLPISMFDMECRMAKGD